MYTLAPKQNRCTLKRVMENLKFRIFAKLWKICAGQQQIKCAKNSNISIFGLFAKSLLPETHQTSVICVTV